MNPKLAPFIAYLAGSWSFFLNLNYHVGSGLFLIGTAIVLKQGWQS